MAEILTIGDFEKWLNGWGDLYTKHRGFGPVGWHDGYRQAISDAYDHFTGVLDPDGKPTSAIVIPANWRNLP